MSISPRVKPRSLGAVPSASNLRGKLVLVSMNKLARGTLLLRGRHRVANIPAAGHRRTEKKIVTVPNIAACQIAPLCSG